jgi:hypothetical protein
MWPEATRRCRPSTASAATAPDALHADLPGSQVFCEPALARIDGDEMLRELLVRHARLAAFGRRRWHGLRVLTGPRRVGPGAGLPRRDRRELQVQRLWRLLGDLRRRRAVVELGLAGVARVAGPLLVGLREIVGVLGLVLIGARILQ